MTMKQLQFLRPVLVIALACAGPALADDDDRHGKSREGKQEFWEGPCKVEREWKKNGDFKEERKCDGLGDRYAEHKEEFRDGPCKVEREWKKNGDYKEERKCDGRDRQHRAPAVAVAQPVYPPWVVVERGEPVYGPGREPAPAPRASVTQCQSETVGRVLGGIAGAVIGNQVGKGSGRTAATVGGAIAGVLIGGEIGRRIDVDNQACIGHALEFAPSGQRVQWENGTRYAVVPGRVVTRDGRHCRPYEAEVLTSAGWQKTQATACRKSDGTWVAAGG